MQQLGTRNTWYRLSLITLLAIVVTGWTGTEQVLADRSSLDASVADKHMVTTPPARGQSLTVSAIIPIASHRMTKTDRGDELSVEGLGYLLIPGKPTIPSKIFSIAIPPGAEVVDIDFNTGESVTLPGTYEIPPAPLPRVIGEEDPSLYEQDQMWYEENYNSVYGSDDAYPQNVVEFVRSAGYRKYNLVDVRVTPFTYRPLSGELTYYPDITVHVNYRFAESPRAAVADALPRKERIAKEIILNYDSAQDWYPQGRSGGRGLHDFVIITLDSLTSSVMPLVDWETYKGRTVEVVTTSWIDSNYTGYDLAARMRAFLRDKYLSDEWGIEDVLLVGHYDDVPMRRTWQDPGYGKPETDFYYAELSFPDSQSWDSDGDHKYGEDSDPIDFYSEVNVGRIPWSEPDTVLNICQKSVGYEQNNDPTFKKNILLLGAYFWADTDNAVLMEVKVDQPWMSDWTMTRMYEKNADYWSSYPSGYALVHSNVMLVWPAGKYAFVNWAGHGSPTSCHIYGVGAPAFISSNDCPSLNDNYPAIIFADACSNSDTDHLNIGQAMLKQGAVGFVGATKVAYGVHAWSNPYSGSSQSFDYFFTTSVTSGDFTQGEAHQWALYQMYVNGLWYQLKYETFEWGALWGNPDLGMTSFPYENAGPLPEDSLGVGCMNDAGCAGEAKCVKGVCYAPKHRYISMCRNLSQMASTARRVKLQNDTVLGWVGTPYESRGLTIADVVASPVYAGIDFVDEWPELLHVTDCEIATGQTYLIQAVAHGQDIDDEGNYSEALVLHTTSVWGDTVSTCVDDVCLPPDGVVGLADVMAAIKKYQGIDVAPLTWLDIDPSAGSQKADQIIGVGDILACLLGFQGGQYLGDGPLGCP